MIVVADDLKSREPEDKERILEHQPSIPTYAKDLFIFTEHEKYRKNLEKIREIIQSSEFSDIITYYFYNPNTVSSILLPKHLICSIILEKKGMA